MRSTLPDGIISMFRGDSYELPLFINRGTKLDPLEYILKSTDRIYVGLIEPASCFERAIMRQVYTSADQNSEGYILIKFLPRDTEHLIPGTYYLEVKGQFITENIETVSTIIPKRKFIILD